jgi:tetratricopeptide (TPR) repeat protein
MDGEGHDGAREAADAVNRAASVLMKRGIALLNENSRASLPEAIGNFERAIEMRSGLPLDMDPLFRYGLAAGCMNLGDALTRSGAAEHLAEAVKSYDAALEVLKGLRLEENPLFTRRVAIAWQNRGLTLHAQKNEVEAEVSLEKAIEILQAAQGIEDRDFLLATARLNLANLLAGMKSTEAAERARSAARAAVGFSRANEMQDAAMAEVGLKARYAWCKAAWRLLSVKGLTDAARDELLAEATDAVDNGMVLARKWRPQFDFLAPNLFSYGTHIYQKYQPQFLSEFLLENLDTERSAGAFVNDAAMHKLAWESLRRAFHNLQSDGFKTFDTPGHEQALELLQELRLVEDRLEALRVASATASMKTGD